MKNRLILVGNGFDLAHGLKTSYKNFLDWYMCKAFQQFCEKKNYSDPLIEIKNKYSGMVSKFEKAPTNFEDTLRLIGTNDFQSISYNSDFFKKLLTKYTSKNWVDIELYYFTLLKTFFSNRNIDHQEVVSKLNSDFDFLIKKLSEYIQEINGKLYGIANLGFDTSRSNIKDVFAHNDQSLIRVVNFNYTETLRVQNYAYEKEIIHIHGRAAHIEENPIIFGYGDESDPEYQKIEDSGENLYLEHFKSFGYFRTNNYHQLLSYIDSNPFEVYIIGHSCGLSDRVLLNEIFEHQNCLKIEIYYHRRKDGTDNFKEITQEISRHFKPQNKNMMRRKVSDKNQANFIPQNP